MLLIHQLKANANTKLKLFSIGLLSKLKNKSFFHAKLHNLNEKIKIAKSEITQQAHQQPPKKLPKSRNPLFAKFCANTAKIIDDKTVYQLGV